MLITMKTVEKYGCWNGLNKQLSMSEKLQNELLHHDIGMSCTARINASGKYDPKKIINPDVSLNCIY